MYHVILIDDVSCLHVILSINVSCDPYNNKVQCLLCLTDTEYDNKLQWINGVVETKC